jgi:glycosyltransferase involved in cell wall biosynthesis
MATRIFTPEPAAAAFALENVALAFADAGWDVRVLTSTFGRAADLPDLPGVSVERMPVLRNAAGYVRGYLGYLSFDIPLFFRLLFMRAADLVYVEPPPTTGAVVRVATALRRVPYVYDAADIWSDAAVTVTRSRLVPRVLRAVERFAIRGARHAVVVAPAYAERLRELGIRTPTTVVGFGVDPSSFDYHPASVSPTPLFVYGGSYSEWHGAGIFVEAFARLVTRHPDARLLFVGNGSERPALSRRVEELGLTTAVEFRDPVAGSELARIFSGATASLASLTPGLGYDYAFATKVYSSLASGCPVVYSGAGPAAGFLTAAAAEVDAGVAVPYDVAAVDAAMEEIAVRRVAVTRRRALSAWTRRNHSLRSVGDRVVEVAAQALPR